MTSPTLCAPGQTKEEFQIEGRTFHEPKFKTESVNFILHNHGLPSPKGIGEDEVQLSWYRAGPLALGFSLALGRSDMVNRDVIFRFSPNILVVCHSLILG
jgi:hypothetical protein